MKITKKILAVKILMVAGIFAALILISQVLFAQSAIEVQGQMLGGGVVEKKQRCFD